MNLSVAEPCKRSQFYSLASIAILLGLLYFGQEVLIPLALAVLIAFLLTPVVTAVERLRLGRVPSSLLVVVAGIALVVGFGWIVEQRFLEIVAKLPDYHQSIQSKFHHLTRPGVVEKVRKEINQTVQEAATTQDSSTTQTAVAANSATTTPNALNPGRSELDPAPAVLIPPTPDAPWPVRLYPTPATAPELIGQYLGKLLSPVATAGLVVVFVIFMLIAVRIFATG
jgi:predicted PurR-regulated permease PerM